MIMPIPFPMYYSGLPLWASITLTILLVLIIIIGLYGPSIQRLSIKLYSNISSFIIYHRYKSKNEKNAKEILDTSKRLNKNDSNDDK